LAGRNPAGERLDGGNRGVERQVKVSSYLGIGLLGWETAGKGVVGDGQGRRRVWAAAVVLRRARGGDLGPVSFSGRWGSRSQAPLGQREAVGGSPRQARLGGGYGEWRVVFWAGKKLGLGSLVHGVERGEGKASM
jgi:hypothetical protein